MLSSLFRKRAPKPPDEPAAAPTPAALADSEPGWRPEASPLPELGLEAGRRAQPLPASEVQGFASRCLDRQLSEALARHRERVWGEKEADLRGWRPRRSTQEISASLRPLGPHVLYVRGRIHPELREAFHTRLLDDLREALAAQAPRWQGAPTPLEVAAVVLGVLNAAPHQLGLPPIAERHAPPEAVG